MRRAILVGATLFIVALNLAACSSGSRVARGTPSATTTSSPRASATGSGSPLSPSAPASPLPYSGRIVFDDSQDVWAVNADGTGIHRLTSDPAPEFDPSWSPDGTLIAFRSERAGYPEIWVMNADGSGQHRLARGLSPSWSPDGSRIAFAGNGGSLTIMNADGSRQRTLPGSEGGEYPSWSPNATRIAFNSNLTGEHRMFVESLDGSNRVDLSARAGEGWQVDWSPDGRSILFASERDHSDGYTDVYVMRANGSGVRRLTHNRGYTPAWSPDGRHVVFSAGGLFFINADGSGLTSLPAPGVGETSLPDWSK